MFFSNVASKDPNNVFHNFPTNSKYLLKKRQKFSMKLNNRNFSKLVVVKYED